MIIKKIKDTVDDMDFKNPYNVLGVCLILAFLIPILCFLSFWLFVWSVKTLFGFDIPFNILHWLAFMVFIGFFRSSTNSKD